MTWISRHWMTVAIVCLPTLAGCSDVAHNSVEGPATSDVHPAPTPLQQLTNVSTDGDICVVKDGKSLILINLFPDIDKVLALNESKREAYLYWRAAKSVLEKGLSNENLIDQEDFVVRLVVVKSFDEYGRLKWGDAIEVARLETNRSVLKPYMARSLESLDEETVVKLFDTKKLQADSLKKIVR